MYFFFYDYASSLFTCTLWVKLYFQWKIICNLMFFLIVQFCIFIYINLCIYIYINCFHFPPYPCCGHFHLYCVSLNEGNRQFNFSLAPECVSVCVGGTRVRVCAVLWLCVNSLSSLLLIITIIRQQPVWMEGEDGGQGSERGGEFAQ